MGWTKKRLAWAAAAYLLLFGLYRAEWLLWAVLRPVAERFPALSYVVNSLGWAATTFLSSVYPMLVLLSTLFGGAIAVIRIARRAPAGSARDPLVQLRDALRAHPRLASALPWLPFAYFLYREALLVGTPWHDGFPSNGAADEYVMNLPLVGAMTALVGKLLLRALDRVRNVDAAPPQALANDEQTFRAVAVTPRSQAIVVGTLGVAVAMVAFMSNVNLAQLRAGSVGLVVLAYAAVLGVTARWYQKASRIRVGSDGVFVHGTSSTRFYSYRDVDSVRVSGATLHLLRSARPVIRLQLHGADLHRGAFLAERIEAALAAATNVSGAETLLAHGRRPGRSPLAAADYRSASLSREQLWELIEADGTAGEARAGAAELLAAAFDPGDRSRLRVAAAHMADPKVRVVLETLAGDVQKESAEVEEGRAEPATARRLVLP